MSNDDAALMRRAIAAAAANLGRTWPNPSVGCVIARDGEVLAVAATASGGRPHAEEQALAELGERARGATAYVTLEPCGARSSGAPSCSERLASAGVARVVIACDDPSPLAAGHGIERLRAAGLPPEVGLLAGEAASLYRGYIHRLRTGRPLIEAADDGQGFDEAFEPRPGEDLLVAAERYGAGGYTRLWTPRGGPLAWELARRDLLADTPA